MKFAFFGNAVGVDAQMFDDNLLYALSDIAHFHFFPRAAGRNNPTLIELTIRAVDRSTDSALIFEKRRPPENAAPLSPERPDYAHNRHLPGENAR